MITCPNCGHHLPEPPMTGLTLQQRSTLSFIGEYAIANGVAPTFEEIQEHLGLASKSGVFRILRCLEDRGAIKRQKQRARAIEVIHA